jgi:hypothetical protein
LHCTSTLISHPALATGVMGWLHAAALYISGGSVYYLRRSVSAADLTLMRRIDELHLEFPFAGSRLCEAWWLPKSARPGVIT